MYRHKLYIYSLLFLLFMGMGCKKEKEDPDHKIQPSDFLSSATYDKLLIEIQCVNGYTPTTATVDNLKLFLAQRLNKTAGITVIINTISSPGKGILSLGDIRDIEKSNRSQHLHDKTLTAYFLFVDAEYSENDGNSKVLGIAYDNTSMAIFEKTVKEFSGGIGKPSVSTLESTVSLHEFGHILGLTNNGTPMQTQHQDEANGRHCTNKNCLMYWEVENSGIIGLMGSNVPSLDPQCLADLKANGGK